MTSSDQEPAATPAEPTSDQGPAATPAESTHRTSWLAWSGQWAVAAVIAFGLASALYLIDAVGAESLGVAPRITIAIVSVALPSAAVNILRIRLRNQLARTEILNAVLALQIASAAMAKQSPSDPDQASQSPKSEYPDPASYTFSTLQPLIRKNLLSEKEVLILLSWSNRVLAGDRLPPDTFGRVAEYARHLAERVGGVTNPPVLPPPPAPPAQR
jgi:hypothetical protein